MKLVEKNIQSAFEVLKKECGIKNKMESYTIEKICVSTGSGRISDKSMIALIQDRLTKITGQKPAPCRARKSIAAFKLREGKVIGYRSTIRGKKAIDFLEKLIHVVLPRTRDFRGIPLSSVDDAGNITIGVSEHTIFPETALEEARDVFGCSVTIVSTAPNKKTATIFFEHIGIPFQQEQEKE